MTDFLKIFQHVACGCGKVMENCECSVFLRGKINTKYRH